MVFTIFLEMTSKFDIFILYRRIEIADFSAWISEIEKDFNLSERRE